MIVRQEELIRELDEKTTESNLRLSLIHIFVPGASMFLGFALTVFYPAYYQREFGTQMKQKLSPLRERTEVTIKHLTSEPESLSYLAMRS